MVNPDNTLGTKTTPMNGDGKPIHSDKNGEPFNYNWNYRSVVGTLMYLATNSRPDIAHAVHSCACFNHNPKQSHGKTLLHICKYLKGTSKNGLILTPSESLTLDLYVDADYAGLYSVEDPTDPICSKSRTGFVITLAGCPVDWKSTLQSESSLSTTESETIALATALRTFIPLRESLFHIRDRFHITSKKKIHVSLKSTVYEDNAATTLLACTKRLSPRTRHIATKHWWSIAQISNENDGNNGIFIQKIDGTVNTADLFTKNTKTKTFVCLRKLLCGW